MSLKSMSRPVIYIATAGVLVSSIGLGTYIWHEQARPAVLEIYLFSLKGTPVMFIRTPEDKRILVNGGANNDVITEITKILPFYSRRIDSIIATKEDSNHVSGLVDVASRYSINEAFIPGVTLNSLGLASTTDPAYKALLDKLNEIKVAPELLKAGDSLALDSQTSMDILFPVASSTFIYSKASAPEVLFKVNYGSTSFVFMGDATTKIQKFIASTSAALFNSTDSTALFIPQSSAPGNISGQLIDVIHPAYVIYSQAPAKLNSKPNSKPPKISSKKSIEDPLESIDQANRYNLKDINGLRIVSDGKAILVNQFK